MVSAFASGRKGTEEVERHGGGVEHRARDKQVGAGGAGPRDAGATVVPAGADPGPRRRRPQAEMAVQE